MANEITVTSGIQIVKGNLSNTVNPESFQATLAGVRVNRTTQSVGTAYEAYAAGDLASAGMARFKNLDTVNFVEIGVEVTGAFYPLIKLLAGESCV